MQAKVKSIPRIPDLNRSTAEDGKTESDLEKAEILAEQFSKVFVVEPEGDIPDCVVKNVPVLNHLEINKIKIKMIIKNLWYMFSYLPVSQRTCL